jgi:hypothetical protein
MSREFGEFMSGYFHDKINYAAEDAANGRLEITRKWGEFLEMFYDIAYAISSAEACDSDEYDPIMVSIAKIPALQREISLISDYLRTYERVMQEAVKKHIRDEAANEHD